MQLRNLLLFLKQHFYLHDKKENKAFDKYVIETKILSY